MGQALVYFNAGSGELVCAHNWDIASLPTIQTLLKSFAFPSAGAIAFNGQAIAKMDTAGAWLLASLDIALKQKGINVHYQQFDEKHTALIGIVSAHIQSGMEPPTIPKMNSVAKVGAWAVDCSLGLKRYLNFIGLLSSEGARIFSSWRQLRIGAYVTVIFRTGWQAMPIIALLSFMIGIVITYQMGLQLKTYGANIFIVDLLGLSVLREFGPLITAIMVAGRTGSAFTAQLGMMKLNQEIDALDTIGVTPSSLLLLPRMIGLVIALPLVTMWADIFGVMGGMVMSNTMLGITWYDFLHRFPTVIPLRALLTGLGKTPIFALVISSIGCYQGMQVKGSADSVGLNTTRSVVLSIFFIIVADAIFSVLFSKFKL
jgi:phospholipid/cholesterol/gamma-HCH transport system permease protein